MTHFLRVTLFVALAMLASACSDASAESSSSETGLSDDDTIPELPEGVEIDPDTGEVMGDFSPASDAAEQFSDCIRQAGIESFAGASFDEQFAVFPSADSLLTFAGIDGVDIADIDTTIAPCNDQWPQFAYTPEVIDAAIQAREVFEESQSDALEESQSDETDPSDDLEAAFQPDDTEPDDTATTLEEDFPVAERIGPGDPTLGRPAPIGSQPVENPPEDPGEESPAAPTFTEEELALEPRQGVDEDELRPPPIPPSVGPAFAVGSQPFFVEPRHPTFWSCIAATGQVFEPLTATEIELWIDDIWHQATGNDSDIDPFETWNATASTQESMISCKEGI